MTSDLKGYRQKRDFQTSGEPVGQSWAGTGPLTFVIQKHNARRLHYDLRLEVDGVLKSWAVPKGPSLDPTQKRLAAAVEDHPLDYASFEGIIPKGEYGGGEVIVWDSGTYSPDEDGKYYFEDREQAQVEMRHGLEKGKLSFYLRGHKLVGSFTLVKVKGREKDWLLIKHRDEHARNDRDVLTEEKSVLSGRTISDIKAGIAPATTAASSLQPGEVPGSRKADFPGFVSPMLASLVESPFSNPQWTFEPKLDGYRVITTIENGNIVLWSRRGNNSTDRYAFLVNSLKQQPVSTLVLDGEVIALDKEGRISFECLQQYLNSSIQTEECRNAPLIYYVFDILYLDGYDLRDVAYRSRRELLKSILKVTDSVRLVEQFQDDGKLVFEAAVNNGLEGVVAKRSDSTYQAGRRSKDWLKVKATLTDDFIIAGYTEGSGSRSKSIGALLLGYLDKNKKLVYAGHVGTGFNETLLVDLKRRLDRIQSDKCPFDEIPKTNSSPTWVRPEMVAEVKFTQWTRDGSLRAPVFLRLRDDKPASDARRTTAVNAPEDDPVDEKSGTVNDVLEQLKDGREKFVIKVEGHEIVIGNLEKVLWPPTGNQRALTKGDFLNYLAVAAPFILPHMKDRPITLSRYPDGIEGQHFWQRHWNFKMPDFVETVRVSEETGKPGEYLMCNNFATLMWLGQTADIEFHTWFSRTVSGPDEPAKKDNPDIILDFPDFIIFDLDPYIYSGSERKGDEPELNRAAFRKVCEIALKLKSVLDVLSVSSFVKTSGKTGLHIYVPIIRELDYQAVRRAAEVIGQYVLQQHPDEITMEWATEKRRGKVFIDYAQNVRGKTLASIYSPRPGKEAGVSFPLRWEDLGSVYPTDYTILTVPALLKKQGDLWAGILHAKRSINAVLNRTGFGKESKKPAAGFE